MFAYVGSSVDELLTLFDALKKSAENDTRKGGTQHGDGWGYVIYDGDNLIHYRSRKAIFEDEFVPPRRLHKFQAIFHARQASKKETVSSRFSHPFLESNEKGLLFLAHNGHVNEDKLKGWVFGNTTTLELVTTDTELVAKALAKHGLSNETLKKLEEFTETALNLLILTINRGDGDARLYYYNYFKKDPEFYTMYVSTKLKGKAVFSSTLLDYGIHGDQAKRGLITLS